MKLPILEVFVYPRNDIDGTVSFDGIQLTDVQKADARIGVETIKDVFSFDVPNVLQSDSTWSKTLGKKNTDNFISEGDFIKIRSYYDTLDTDDNNTIIYGEVIDYSYSAGNTGASISVNGANITENLLRGYALGTYTYSGSTNTASNIVIDIIERRLRFGGITANRKIYAALEGNPIVDTVDGVDNVNITGTTGNVSATSKQITYSKFWQPAYRILEDLSAPEYTGDEDAGNYIFYVQAVPVLPQYVNALGTNFIYELVFKPATQTVSKTISRGTDYKTINTRKNTDELVNVLIIKPGVDTQGRGIIDYAANTESLAKNGPKYSLYAKPEIASKIRTDERQAGENLGSPFTGDLPDDTGSSFPWDFNTIFVRETNPPFSETATLEQASNQDEYDEIIRQEARFRGKIEGQRIVDNLGEPVFECTVELYTGSNDVGMGNLIAIKDTTFGWDNTVGNPTYKLRLRDIRHSWDSAGWNTTWVLKEDEKVISDNINR